MLTDDVRNAIQKNLPATVADELKEFIKVAQDTEALAKKMKEDYKTQEDRAKDLYTQAIEKDKELVVLRARASEFEKADSKVRTAEIHQAIASAKLEGAMEVTRLVFSNNTIKKTVQAYGSAPIAQNGYVGSGGTTENRTETTEG